LPQQTLHRSSLKQDFAECVDDVFINSHQPIYDNNLINFFTKVNLKSKKKLRIRISKLFFIMNGLSDHGDQILGMISRLDCSVLGIDGSIYPLLHLRPKRIRVIHR